MNKKIIVEQIVEMLENYEGCEKVITHEEENEIHIYGYYEYEEGVYNSRDISYCLEFDENDNLKYLKEYNY